MTAAKIVPIIAVLFGCASPEPKIVERVVTHEIKVEVPIPCRVMVDNRPAYPDTAEALRGLPIDQAVQRLLAARELRGPYEDQLERALAGCR